MRTSQSPFPTHARVVAYLRDSGGDEQDLSIAQQEAHMRAWCQKNDLTLTRVFTDAAQPGSSTVSRGGFLAMIDHFHDPHCPDDGVLIWKFSRFSRDQDDSQFYRADLRHRGYIVHSLHDQVPDSSDGRIFEALIDWRNQKFLEDLSQDVKRGLHYLVSEYRAVPGVPPKGFKRERIQIGRHRNGSPRVVSRWVPDPDLWDQCKQAWLMRSQGLPIRVIHKKLQLFGALNSYTTFFTNRLYLGELRYGPVVIPDYTEPMITREVWEMVQNMNQKNNLAFNPAKGSGNRRHPRRANSSFLLSGLLFCPRCGSILNGTSVRFKNGRQLDYYHCHNSHNNRGCVARRVPKKAIEDLVIQRLREYVLDPAVIRERDKELALARQNEPERIKTELKKIDAKLTTAGRRISNIVNQITDDENPPVSLKNRLHELENESRSLEAEKERLISMLNRETVFVRDPQQIERMIRGFDRAFAGEDLEKKRDALRSLVVKVIAERDGDYVRGVVKFINPDDTPGLNAVDELGGDMSMSESHRRESNP